MKYQWLREMLELDDSCDNSGEQRFNAEVRQLIAERDMLLSSLIGVVDGTESIDDAKVSIEKAMHDNGSAE